MVNPLQILEGIATVVVGLIAFFGELDSGRLDSLFPANNS